MKVEIENHDGYPQNFGFKSFLKYFPTRYSVSHEYQENRQIVYSFKDGTEIPAVDQLFVSAINHLKNAIRNSEVWICPIPSSTLDRNFNRYFELCQRITNYSNTNNGYHLITPMDDRPEIHVGGNRNYENVLTSLFFDPEINRKKIILIDDVITTGKSYKLISRKLRELGASSVFGIMLAKTHWPSESVSILEEGIVPHELPPEVPLDLEYREDIDNFF